MDKQIILRIILEKPVSGVDYGVQKGKGSKYEIIQKQTSDESDITFEIPVSVKMSEKGVADFSGPFVQGPPQERFIYVGIGTYAGQKNTPWSRRLKIPLTGISKTIISKESGVLIAKVPGTGKDGGPNCATVKPFSGWR